jgi:Zn-dependent protease/CBS domain-containing protein
MNEKKAPSRILISPHRVSRGGIKLFSVFGIDIYLNYTWFIVLFLIAWSLAYGYYQPQIPQGSHFTYWSLGFLTSVLFFLCILLHEISHSYVSKKSGIPVPRITLFMFGGVAQISREPPDPQTEIKVAAAGPIMSGVLLALFFGLYLLTTRVYDFPILSAVFGILTFINGAVALFNLVPGFPLDGGRLLRAFLWKRKGDLQQATLITSRVGQGFAIALILLGFFQFFLGNIVGGIWLIFIGFFLEQAAASGYQKVLIREGLSGTKVKEIMSQDVISIEENLSLSELVENYFFKHRFNTYPVVKDGKFLGCINLNNLKQFPKEKWHQVKVAQAMEKLSSEDLLHAEDEAVEALRKMVRTGRGRLPVLKEDRLVGILTRRDIMSFLKIKTDLGLQ